MHLAHARKHIQGENVIAWVTVTQARLLSGLTAPVSGNLTSKYKFCKLTANCPLFETQDCRWGTVTSSIFTWEIVRLLSNAVTKFCAMLRNFLSACYYRCTCSAVPDGWRSSFTHWSLGNTHFLLNLCCAICARSSNVKLSPCFRDGSVQMYLLSGCNFCAVTRYRIANGTTCCTVIKRGRRIASHRQIITMRVYLGTYLWIPGK